MRILHISDQRFRTERSDRGSGKEIAAETICNSDMIRALENMTKKQPLDYIFITVEIVCRATQEAYREAGKAIAVISKVSGVPVRRIFLCQGSHDAGIKSTGRPECECRLYSSFCHDMGLPAYKLDGKWNYQAGVAVTRYLNVICLNTAWFSENESGKDREQISAGLIRQIKKEKRYDNGRPVIVLMHHPAVKRNKGSKNGDSGSYGEIAGIADMILTGCDQGAEDGDSLETDRYVCGNTAVYRERTCRQNLHIYEWDSSIADKRPYGRTAYGVTGSRWNRPTHNRAERQPDKKNADQPLKNSFSVLWWTR